MQKKQVLLVLASNERTVQIHETQKKKHWYFSALEKSLVNLWVHQHFFYISMHSYQNTDKIHPEYPDKPKSRGGDPTSGGLSGIMCKQLF